MKRTLAVVIAIFLLTAAPWLMGKTGCMSKSWNLTQKFDNKSYHYVSCSCPCDRYKSQGFYAQKKHQCLECGHQHDPQTVLILDKIPVSNGSDIHLPPSMHTIMGRLITRWKQARNAS
jgi:hypothetical protein